MTPKNHIDEIERLAVLRSYAVLDTPPEAAFDELATLAAHICETPTALVSLVDEARQWFKASVGLDLRETPLEDSVCARVMHSGNLTELPDLEADPRFKNMGIVRGPHHLRFYAGVPLLAPSGHPLGTLCVIDRQARRLNDLQREALRVLAGQVMAQLELRRHAHEKARAESALLGILEDEREAKRALRRGEKEQRELAQRLAMAQHVAKVGSWETDLATMTVRWSDETHRIFETDAGTFAPTHAAFLERVHPEDREKVSQAFATSLTGEGIHRVEHRLQFPDGRTKHIEERWQISTGPDDRPELAIGTCQDVTERRQAETHLRLLEKSVSHLNDIVIITRAFPLSEPGPEILFVNDAFERVTGYSREEALGRSPRFLQGKDTSRAALDRLGEAIKRGQPAHEELYNYNKNGRGYWLDINISPVADAQGRVTHFVAVQRDITERKKLEEQFLRAQRMESIGTLAGGIAHDLNNLLAPILMGLDLLRQINPDPKCDRVLENMERSAKRGAELVRQVLSFARGVDGMRVIVSIEHTVNEVAEIVRNTFPKNIELTRRLAPDLRNVTGDPTQLNQVLLNLCVNARDAMPHGGNLLIAASNVDIDPQFAAMSPGAVAGAHVVIEVRDSGLGMSKEVCDRIFEPFFTTKEVGSGTGLGLSTVLGIVRSHAGFVQVYSEPGRGSTFKVYLPAASVGQATRPDEIGPPELPRGNGELVLIVDDEPSILSVTKQTLEAFGYRAITAEDGAQAIALFARQPDQVRVIITDMMMPVMDGIALIAAIRRLDAEVPIVAASGLASNNSIAQASAAGVRHFLAKPYTTDLLLQTLRKALATAPSD